MMMITMLRSDLFQRFAGGFAIGAVAVLAFQPEGALPFLDAIKAATGLA